MTMAFYDKIKRNGKTKFKKKQNFLPQIGLRPGTCPATYFRLDNLVCCIVIRFLLAIDYREREKQGDKAAKQCLQICRDKHTLEENDHKICRPESDRTDVVVFLLRVCH